ncbi:PLP-dependent aminotransferase family protein [Brucella tritici]|uniref:PLP-dependent aminotransferase family protein n=1 Tax=Brucella tritici TaxID=94626 RepID=A0A6L3YN78_9HYPH|nr:PLP-dependent aminotransferase family protein [Brucella tritici]KAB2684380.1 PLP-dependent aminotransferase family protein [Brucella tritici]
MGKGATLALEVIPEGREPIFLALTRSIIAEIERGRLKPGEALPGTRALSRSLGLNRNTVDAAYQELITQGWLATTPSRGTFVSRDLPDFGRERGRNAYKTAADMPLNGPTRLAHRLSDGVPDARLAPTVELGQAFRRAVASSSFYGEGGYGDTRGSPFLRDVLSFYLKDERGLTAAASDILVTQGSQMALFLAASAVAESGAVIAVETPGYPLAWAAFRAAGAQVRPVPVDEGGIDVDALELLARQETRLRAIYVTPHHQYPTTVTLGAGRRMRLLDLARRYNLVIIEDDYDHEYRFDGRPVLPLAARSLDDAPVIYLGSLSKLIAPGIRLGYAVGPATILRRMADRREAIDRQGNIALEHALGELIADGTIRRHARKARRVYQTRRDRLAELLTSLLRDQISFVLPAGGLALWAHLRQPLSAETWATNAARLGLSVLPGVSFVLDATHAPECFRMGYASLDETEMEGCIRLLKDSMPN